MKKILGEIKMNLQRILKDNNIPFKQIDKDEEYTVLKINNKIMLLCVEEKGNIFKLHRDYYDYIEGNSLPYMIVLCDIKNKKSYLLDLTKGVNWVKNSFESCDKDELFLGKQILNYSINESDLIKALKRKTK